MAFLPHETVNPAAAGTTFALLPTVTLLGRMVPGSGRPSVNTCGMDASIRGICEVQEEIRKSAL